MKSGKPRSFNSVGFVFPGPGGTPWLPDAFSSAFYYGVRARKLPIVSVHGLRHTYATLGLRAGTSIKVVSQALGHSTISITGDVYTHVLRDQLDEAASALGSRLLDTVDRLAGEGDRRAANGG